MGLFSSVKSFVGGALGADPGAKDRAKQAMQATTESSQQAIDLQREQFEQARKILSPFVQAGSQAQQAQMGLLGFGGQDPFAQIAQGPEFQALQQQGEEAILQNAAATGGLRGGNVQAALAQFRPQLLSSLVNQQFNRLGQVAQLGQASAAGQAAAGQHFAGQAGQQFGLIGQAGAARALVPGSTESLLSGLGQQSGQAAKLLALQGGGFL